jgi:hypothetical protein
MMAGIRCRRARLALAAACLVLLATGCADPSRIVSPPPHGRLGRTVANGGVALTVHRIELTAMPAATGAAPTYRLDAAVTIENRAWADATGFALEPVAFALEGAGTDGRRFELQPCGRAVQLGHGDAIDAGLTFFLDSAPAPKVTVALAAPSAPSLLRYDLELPAPAHPIATPLQALPSLAACAG